MNFYTRINKSILERFPTMWNTHFVWMILICLLTHVLYFGLGYASLNIEILKEESVRSLFFNGSYFSFYCIIGLLALIYFGFRYFTHNPFKHFYPIGKMYFWKILAQLFVIFLLYSTVFISFENGLKLKAKKITPIEIVEKEAEQIALATPFFYNSLSDYEIKSRSFPEPFPCEEISDFVIGYDSTNDFEIKHRIDYKKPYVDLGRRGLYQFGKIKQERVDDCKTKEVLDTIYDVSKIYGLAEYSLYNYSGSQLRGNRKYINEYNTEPEEDDVELEKIHNWQKNKDSVSIAKAIQNVMDICKKYSIKEQLNPIKMASAGLKQNLNEQQLIRTGFIDYQTYRLGEDIDRDVAASSVSVASDGNGNDVINGIPQIDYNYFVDIPKFTTLKDNVENLTENMGTLQLKTQILWALILGSLFAAFCFVMLKYLVLKDLIIGVFVAGVLMALLALYIAATERHRYGNSENRIMIASLFYTALILGIGFYGFFGNAIKKQLFTKWFVAFGVAMFAFPSILLLYIREHSYTEVVKNCDINPTKIYAFEFTPWLVFGVALLCIYIIFTMIRKMYAKVE
jgi:hypothetical protein